MDLREVSTQDLERRACLARRYVIEQFGVNFRRWAAANRIFWLLRDELNRRDQTGGPRGS